MIDLARVLRAVVTTLERSDIGYVVVGSTAAASWGVARATRDIDLVVQLDPETLEIVLTSLEGTGLYVPVGQARAAGTSGGSFNVLDPDQGGKVDVFVALPEDPFTRSRLDRRVRAEVFDVPCWVASAEDVLLAKLRWRLTSRSEVQWRDCVEIAATNVLDDAYLCRWANQLGVSDDLRDLLDLRPDGR